MRCAVSGKPMPFAILFQHHISLYSFTKSYYWCVSILTKINYKSWHIFYCYFRTSRINSLFCKFKLWNFAIEVSYCCSRYQWYSITILIFITALLSRTWVCICEWYLYLNKYYLLKYRTIILTHTQMLVTDRSRRSRHNYYYCCKPVPLISIEESLIHNYICIRYLFNLTELLPVFSVITILYLWSNIAVPCSHKYWHTYICLHTCIYLNPSFVLTYFNVWII